MTFFRCFVKKRGRCGVSPLEGVAENAVVELVETMAFGVRGRSPFGSIFNGSSIVGWFHPTLNLNNIDPECGDLDYIRGEGRKMDAEYVMSNNFAFAGINTSLIFKKWSDK